MLNDHFRYIITRWRLSNHSLKIETGRYTRPITSREDRACDICSIIEDEYHAVFVCPLYHGIRSKYLDLISCNDITKFLNPDYCDMKDTACFLHEIEVLRQERAINS